MFVRGGGSGGGGGGNKDARTRGNATSETAARFVSTFAVAGCEDNKDAVEDNKVPRMPPLDLLAQRTLGI